MTICSLCMSNVFCSYYLICICCFSRSVISFYFIVNKYIYSTFVTSKQKGRTTFPPDNTGKID